MEISLERKREVLQSAKKTIALYLTKCDETATPYVCKLKSTPEGYHKVEQFVLKMVARDRYLVGEAIVYMERTMNPNMTND